MADINKKQLSDKHTNEIFNCYEQIITNLQELPEQKKQIMYQAIVQSLSKDLLLLKEPNFNRKNISHKLKGSASLIGAYSLYQIAKSLQVETRPLHIEAYRKKLIESLDFIIFKMQYLIKEGR